MKMKEIREINAEEVLEKVALAKKELLTLRVQAKTGKLENHSKIKKTRRDVARLLTFHTELNNKS